MKAMKAIADKVQNGTMTYPRFTPHVNKPPPIVGPAALPTALKLVASPLIVPNTRMLGALFVSIIVLVGNENVPPTPRIMSSATIAISLASGSGISERNGVMKKTKGKMRKDIRKQRRTPR